MASDTMLTIRKACEEDFHTILEIKESSVIAGETRGFVPPGGVSTEFLEALRQELKLKEPNVIIAEEDGKSVGFAYYHCKRDRIEIEEMDVLKEYQEQGAGRALLLHIEETANQKGVKYLETGTSINKEGKPWKAYGFWTHMGFIDTGERIDSSWGLIYMKLVKPLERNEPSK